MDGAERPVASRAALLASQAPLVALVAWCVARSPWNSDEGFYAVAARLVTEGEVPYRDFGFSQGPGYPLLMALPLRLAGGGFVAQRALSALVVVCAVAVASRALWAASRRVGASLAVLVVASSSAALAASALGKTYALAGLALAVAGSVYVASPSPSTRALSLFAAASSIAVATRISLLPAVAVLAVGLLLALPRERRLRFALGLSLAVVAPYAVAFVVAPEPAAFWLWEYHHGSHLDLRDARTVTEFVRFAPLVWVVSLFAMLRPVGEVAQRLRVVGVATLVGVAAQMLFSTTYAEYAAPFVPLGALCVGALPDRRRVTLAFAGLCALVGLLGFLGLPSSRADTTELRAAASFVRAHTRPGDLVLASPASVLGDAQRRPLPDTEMSPFCVADTTDASRARRLHLVTTTSLAEAIRAGRPRAVVLYRQARMANFQFMVPSLDLAGTRGDEIERAFTSRYQIAWASARLLVLLPR
ncbi:MAG: hypothetical protein U0326_35810 [Polyangiales bacterium]